MASEESGTTINIGIVATDEASAALQEASASVDELTGQIAEATPAINAMSGSLDGVAGSFGGLGASEGEYVANLAIIQKEAAGAVGEITVMGDVASGAAIEVDAAGADAAVASGGFDVLQGSMIKSLAPLAALIAGYEGLRAVFEGGKAELDQWQESNALATQGLKDTHDAVGMNITQLDNLAQATSKNTDFTKANNMAIEATLVTVDGMNKDTMPQAVQLTDDLATKMAALKGQSVPSLQQTSMAAKAMAKALSDPTAATGAFTRTGLTLDAQQKAALSTWAATATATDKQTLSISGVTAAGAKALMNWNNLTSAQQTAAEAADKITPAQIAQAKAMGLTNVQTDSQKKLMSILSGYVGGDATAAANTYAGKVAEVKKNMDDLSASIINGLERALEAVAHALVNTFLWLDKHRVVLAALAAAVIPVVVMGIAALAVGLWGMAGAAIGAATGFSILGVSMLPLIIIAALIGAAAYEIIKHWKTLQQTAEKVVNAVIGFWNQLTTDAENVENSVGGFFKKLGADISKVFKDVIDFIKTHWELIGAILLAPVAPVLLVWKLFHTQITGVFNSIVGDIKNVFKDAGTWLEDAGKAIVQGLINGITGMIGGAGKAISSVMSGIAKFIPHSPAEEGPFSGSGWTLYSGQAIVNALAQGITSQGSVATSAMQKVMGGVAGGIGIPSVGGPSLVGTSGASPLSSSAPVYNNSASNSTSSTITIQQLVVQAPNGATMKSIFDSLNQDTLNVSRGAAPVSGAY